MLDEIILNFFLLVYLLLVLFEDKIKTKNISLIKLRAYAHTVTLKKISPILVFLVGLTLLLILKGHRNIFYLYIYTTLSLLILLNIVWVSWESSKEYKRLAFLFVGGIIIVRILYPTVVSHDLFIILTVVGLGPIITSLRFFTTKFFLFISSTWCIYDVVYVWLTSSHSVITTATRTVGFPLAFVVGNTSIGLADLFYASLLIAIIRERKYKLLAVSLLVGSNIVLAAIAYSQQLFTVFPLLVLWVPCGFLVLIFEKLAHRNSICD